MGKMKELDIDALEILANHHVPADEPVPFTMHQAVVAMLAAGITRAGADAFVLQCRDAYVEAAVVELEEKLQIRIDRSRIELM